MGTAATSEHDRALAGAAAARQPAVQAVVAASVDLDTVDGAVDTATSETLAAAVSDGFGPDATVLSASLTDRNGVVVWGWSGGPDAAPAGSPGATEARALRAPTAADGQARLIYELPVGSNPAGGPVATLAALVIDPGVTEAADHRSMATTVVPVAAGAGIWLVVLALTAWLLRCTGDETENQRKVAMVDPLTGLANRSALDERGRAAFANAARHGGRVGLVVVDLDRFKQVNDTGGHALGDRVLVEVARRLLAVTRRDELAVRVGGDEFAVLVPTVPHRNDLDNLASRLRTALEIPVRFASADEVRVTASVGVASSPEHGSSLEELFKAADAGMYAEKHRVRRPLEDSLARARRRREDASAADAPTQAANETDQPRRAEPV